MQIARYKAAVFTKGNKLFVICGNDRKSYFLETSEVYDSISQKFTFIESKSHISWSSNLLCTYFKENNNIIVIYDNRLCFYNIDTNSWSKSTMLKIDKKMCHYTCVEFGKLIK